MHCISLSLRGSCIELSKAIEVMKQLPISNPKKVISSSLPYHEKLIESCSGHSNDDKLPCRLCNTKIDVKFMRCHVGYHIINEDVQNVWVLWVTKLQYWAEEVIRTWKDSNSSSRIKLHIYVQIFVEVCRKKYENRSLYKSSSTLLCLQNDYLELQIRFKNTLGFCDIYTNIHSMKYKCCKFGVTTLKLNIHLA